MARFTPILYPQDLPPCAAYPIWVCKPGVPQHHPLNQLTASIIMRHVVRFDPRHHVSGICVELTRMMLSIDERDLKAKLNEHNSLIGVGSVGDGIANLIAGFF